MVQAVVVDAVRSPNGKGRSGGSLAGVHAVGLLAPVLRGLMERTGIDPGTFDDVVVGCVGGVGERSGTPGRPTVLAAGFPVHVPSVTVERKCGSGQQAVDFAVQGVQSGANDHAPATRGMATRPCSSGSAERAPNPSTGRKTMDLQNSSAVVTGGASRLGLATVRHFVERGVPTVMLDLPSSEGEKVAKDLGDLATFAAADVTDPAAVDAALDTAATRAPIRALVHCAGRGGTVRLVEKDGEPGSLEAYESIVRTNLIGTFNVLRLTAARMVTNEPVDGERGVCVLTASVAAWEGQIGQIPYASAKAGVVGMTLVAARDLARKLVRVCSIAPGTFDTPILSRFPVEVLDKLAAQTPHPQRLGRPDEFAALAHHIIDNAMLNGEVLRLDGAIRMAAR